MLNSNRIPHGDTTDARPLRFQLGECVTSNLFPTFRGYSRVVRGSTGSVSRLLIVGIFRVTHRQTDDTTLPFNIGCEVALRVMAEVVGMFSIMLVYRLQ